MCIRDRLMDIRMDGLTGLEAGELILRAADGGKEKQLPARCRDVYKRQLLLRPEAFFSDRRKAGPLF